MENINHLADLIGNVSPVLVSGIAAVVEVVLRLVKSDKPLGILHLVAAGARSVGNLLSKIADFSDKILPQRLS